MAASGDMATATAASALQSWTWAAPSSSFSRPRATARAQHNVIARPQVAVDAACGRAAATSWPFLDSPAAPGVPCRNHHPHPRCGRGPRCGCGCGCRHPRALRLSHSSATEGSSIGAVPLSRQIEALQVCSFVPAGALLMRALRATPWEQGLVQIVVLPLVLLTVCCMVGAAVGIECVESLRETLASEDAEQAEREIEQAAEFEPRDDHLQKRGKERETDMLESLRESKYPKRLREEPHEREAAVDCGMPRKKARGICEETGFEEPIEVQPELTNKNDNDEDRRTDEEEEVVVAMPAQHVEAAIETEKNATPRLPRRKRRRVVIWDLDETLVLFASLYSGEFARANRKDVATSVVLGEQMMSFLLAVLDRHFYFHQLHDVDIDHISSLPPVYGTLDGRSHSADGSMEQHEFPLLDKTSPAFMQHVAARFKRIRALYERRGEADFLDDKTSQWYIAREALVTSIDMFSAGWIKEAKDVLDLIANTSTTHSNDPSIDTSDINVLVTNTQLAPALCKCLIYGLDSYFPIESIYSSAKVRKRHCFEQIIAKYSTTEDVEFIAIGDGQEEQDVSSALGVPFFKVRSLQDLQRLRVDLQFVDHEESADTAKPTALKV